jgi:flagellar hook protein FlgE
VVSDGERYLYTRAGDFTLDKDGYLKTQQGLFLQGYGASQGVVTPGTLGNIQVTPGLAYPPKTSSYFMMNLNLNTNEDVYTVGPPATGGIFSSNVDVYDSLGSPHTVTVTFTKTAANTWQYDVTLPAASVSGATGPVNIGTGSLSFDPATGELSSPAGTVPPTPIALTPSVTLNNGANFPSTLNWYLHDTDGNSRLTQFATKSTTSSVSQDGYGAGSLIGIQVETTGLVQGVFSNGQYRTLGQVILASFHNPQGLSKEGQNQYAETNISGAHAYGVPGAGGLGTLLGNSLEMSNVDMAEEFTKMILGQRGYQANSRVITTSDELMQEALNLKR